MMASETTGTEFSLVEQGTGIGQSTLPTVGYLGKVYESCKLNSECCPACKLKGQTRTLQAFRISFKESIVLCENPQCIYPLGHKPLQAITTSGSKSRNDQTKHSPRKRKIFESTNLISSDFESFGQCTKQLKPCPEPSLITNVGHEENRNLSEQKFISINSSNDHIILGTSTSDGPLEPSLVPEVIVVPGTAPQIPIQCAVSDTKHFPKNLVCSNTQAVIAPADIVPKLHRTSFLQWRNKDALCWLDCILSSFVHLQTLEKAVAEPCTDEDSIFKRLFMTYNKASNLISQFTEGDHVSPSSLNVLSNAENLLNEIRSTIFELLQPQLKCQLGKNDMPVFALPLFIEKDPSFQKLFMQSFYWKFECLLCGYKSKDRCCKTLTTFTKVIAEWHPLNAVHVAPCNNCRDQSQRREMVLEKVPPVFMLHFSEGLPHRDLKAYSFQFEGDFYEITMIIQYQNKHFATWVLTPEGSWLECDDVKGSYSPFHASCKVPPSEIHIVYWERRNGKANWEPDLQLQHETSEALPFTNAWSTSLCLGAEPRGVTAVLSEMDLTDTPSLKLLDIACEGGQRISSFMNLSDCDLATPTLVDLQVDSEKRSQENGIRLGMCDAVENEPATLLQTSCQSKGSPKKTQQSKSQSIQLLGQSNATATAATTLQVDELSEVERMRFIDNSVITPMGPQSNLACEGDKLLNTTGKIKYTPGKQESTNIVVNESVSDPPSIPSPKKEFASNWIKSLIGRHPILPTSLSVSNETNSKCSVRRKQPSTNRKFSKSAPPLTPPEILFSLRKACNYGGFISKNNSKSSENVKVVPPSGCGSGFPHPEFTSLPIKNRALSSASKFGGFKSTHDKEISPAVNGSLKHELIFNGHQKHLSKSDSSREHKINRFRLKLLRKLKAKKNELASLDMLANANGTSPNEALTNPSECGANSKHESLQDLLTALQEHINSVENESVYLMSSNNSLCSSPGDTDFLEELLSPGTPSSLEMTHYGEDGSRLLEMLVDKDNGTSLPIHLTNGTPCTVNPINGYNDYSFLEKQAAVSNNSKVNGLNTSCSKFGSSGEKDVFEDMLSCTFSSVGVDTDVSHFDEYF